MLPIDNISLMIVGYKGGTAVADSFERAAKLLGLKHEFVDAIRAHTKNRVLNSIVWRANNRRPLRFKTFNCVLQDRVIEFRPNAILTTGQVPVSDVLLQRVGKLGISRIHFSTDDPWNPNFRADWFLSSLQHYDYVYTPRQANLLDFMRVGCKRVNQMFFAYDETLIAQSGDGASRVSEVPDVLFVGGADLARAQFIEELLGYGVSICLVGAYWHRYRTVKKFALGIKNVAEVALLTQMTKINLCLVRQANRDGHVMRSFEIAALGGCMLAEDTTDHRSLFGQDGECCRYFSTASQAAQVIRELVNDPVQRGRMASALRQRLTSGRHTYTHRLYTMVKEVFALPQTREI